MNRTGPILGPVTRDRALGPLPCLLPEVGQEYPPGSFQVTEAVCLVQEPPGSAWHYRAFVDQSVSADVLGEPEVLRARVEMVMRIVIDGTLVFSVTTPGVE